MASNIIAPQPLPTSTTLTEDLIKMFTQPATLSELVEKEPSLKRHFQQVFSPNEPPGKRAAPAFQLPPQMQNNLSLTQQQQQLLQHQVMQQALSRGQATLPANFQLPGNLLPSLGAVPHIDIDKIRKEQLQQQQQQLHQQQIQQAQQLQQQQMQQQQQQQHQQHQQQQLAQIQQQQQIYQQQQLQLLQQHQRAVQQQQQQQQSLQQIQQIPAGQAAVRGGMIDLRQAQQASNYDLNLLMRYQQAQLAQTSAAQSAQAQAMQSQMPPRRQTISTATLPQSMANAIPRLHRPSPQLMPNTSPILSTSAPVGPAAVPTPKIQNFIQPIVPTRSPVALTPLNPTATKGPDDPEFIRFLLLTRQNEHNLHSMMGDSMIRLPGTSSKE